MNMKTSQFLNCGKKGYGSKIAVDIIKLAHIAMRAHTHGKNQIIFCGLYIVHVRAHIKPPQNTGFVWISRFFFCLNLSHLLLSQVNPTNQSFPKHPFGRSSPC